MLHNVSSAGVWMKLFLEQCDSDIRERLSIMHTAEHRLQNRKSYNSRLVPIC